MGKDEPTFTEDHIKLVATKAAEELVEKKEKLRNDPNGMGCPSHLGSVALKRHLAYHSDKLNSDINDLCGFKEEQREENKILGDKVTKVAHMFHDNASDLSKAISKLSDILNNFNKLEDKVDENKKNAETNNEKTRNGVWTIIKWAAGIMITLGCTAYFSVNRSATDAKAFAIKAETIVTRVEKKVERINEVDRENQTRTEDFFALTISKLTNKPVDEIIKEHNEMKKEKKQ